MQEHTNKWMELLSATDRQDKMTDKQIKIVEAAIEVFSEKGYAGSSTSEIASRAGVAEGTIFRHYKTKKDLLMSIVLPMMLHTMGPLFAKEFAKVIKTTYGSIEDFLRSVIRDRLEFVRHNLPIIKILIQEIPFHDDLRNTFKDIVREHIIAHMVKVIEHYRQQGIIIDMPTESTIRFVISSGIGLLVSMLLIVPELDWDEEAEIERTVQMVLYGISAEKNK